MNFPALFADRKALNLKLHCGERRIRTSEGIRQQIYSLPQLATLVSPQSDRADGGIRTPDQLITNQLLWPTELHRLIPLKNADLEGYPQKSVGKCMKYFIHITK